MDGDFELHAPLKGRALGGIVASREPGLPEGELILTPRADTPTRC
ncbi:hypothetical protein ACFZB4_33370 [Streptomyces pseudovenezuelae]